MSFAFSLALVPALVNAQESPQIENPAAQTPAEPPAPTTPPPTPTAPPTPPPTPLLQGPPATPVLLSPPAAAPVTMPVTPPKPEFPTRSLRIAPSLQVLLYEPFPYQKISRIGTGLFGAYECFLKPSFVIGINLPYRFYPGQARLPQVGYRLMLKHYLAGMNSPDSTFMPYVEYGLLLQINKVSGRQGTGTAHDTRLSAGTDFRIAKKIFFVEASWHYSRLGLFEQTGERLDNLEFDVGYRYPW